MKKLLYIVLRKKLGLSEIVFITISGIIVLTGFQGNTQNKLGKIDMGLELTGNEKEIASPLLTQEGKADTTLNFFKKFKKDTSLRSMKYTSMPKKEAVIWQKELRTKLFDILKMSDLVSKDKNIQVNVKTLSSTEEDKYILYEKEMNSTSERRMKFVTTVPLNREGPFPAIIFLAGHGGVRHTVYGEEGGYYNIGRHLAANGYVTVSVKISQHEIHEPSRPPYTLMGERLWDLMRCVDYLVTRDNVDPERIGAGGKSLGGEMVMWLGAMDERVKVNFVAGFLTTMDQMEEGHCMCWKVSGLRKLVDYADIYSMIAPRALSFQNGIDEPSSQFPPSLALKVFDELAVTYMDFEVPQNVSLVVHKGGHVIHVPSVLGFFDQHLRKDLKLVPFSERSRR